MSRAARRVLSVGVPAFALMLPVGPARADIVGLGSRSASIELAVEAAQQKIASATTVTRINDLRMEERLHLRNEGAYLFSPSLISLALGADLGLSQEWLRPTQERQFRDGTLLGYDVFTTLLEEQPTSLSLFAARSQSVLSQELASRNDVVTQQRGATLFARRLPFPSMWAIRQELSDEASRTGEFVSRRDDRRTILSYEGQRGWTDQELDVKYELVRFEDAVTPSFDYDSHEASFTYGSDFGMELNRHEDLRARLLVRQGQTDVTTALVDELLRVDHTERFWSEYRYFLSYADTDGQASTTHTLTAGAHHRLYDNLTTSLAGDSVFQIVPGGRRDVWRTRLDTAYTKRLPWQGRLMGGLGGRLEYQADAFQSATSFAPQEIHTAASPVALPITLQGTSIMSSSVVVTKTSLGPLPAGCAAVAGPPVALVLGRDYTLLPTAQSLQVVPLPCFGSTPGINPGDTIVVDYQFSVVPSMTFSTVSWRTDLSVDYRWIRPYVSYGQTAQQLLSGLDNGTLDQQRSDAAGVELRYDQGAAHAGLLGEISRLDSKQVGYDRLRSSQFVTHSPWPDVTLSMNVDEAWMDFWDPPHQTRTLNAQLAMTYAPAPSLLVEGSASLRRLADTLLLSERDREARLRLRWLIRRVELLPTFSLIDRRRGDTHTEEWRMLVRMVRRF